MTKLREWWRWVRRIDWVLENVERTEYSGFNATQLCPYFIETWRDLRTGEFREVACT